MYLFKHIHVLAIAKYCNGACANSIIVFHARIKRVGGRGSGYRFPSWKIQTYLNGLSKISENRPRIPRGEQLSL